MELEKTAGIRWTCFALRVSRTLNYLTINLKCTDYHNECQSQKDRQTDEHHGNSATIRSNERIALYETQLLSHQGSVKNFRKSLSYESLLKTLCRPIIPDYCAASAVC